MSSDKLYQDLLVIRDNLNKDNHNIDILLESLYIKKEELDTIINKRNYLNSFSKSYQDKTDSIILSSLINTLAVIFEIIYINKDNGISSSNIPTLISIPLISSSLSYLFFRNSKNDEEINKHSDRLEEYLDNTNNKINELLKRKTTNNKILDKIYISLPKLEKDIKSNVLIKEKTLVNNHNELVNKK